ncbi:hypothetical protein RclHR1_00470018 [Rhizophagus clarus]|uniref:Protein kinase domain-containing protein n=1 Tax=Rhizophagus clarus TaxID=94130 RepID=A0A2Z6RIE0_9GLOM|nr:hypothetical protein RclHR1_00470018 [Rhizophagus clarus]
MVFNYENYEIHKIKCEKCGEYYDIDARYQWCSSCQIKYLEANFSKWTSGNKNVDNIIRKKQLKINSYTDIILEWIPYEQFYNVREIENGNFSLAIWKDGPLKYDYLEKKDWIRVPNKKVVLELHPYNSQNITSEFLNKMMNYYFLKYKVYGITQNPDTKNYIIVYRYEQCEKCGKQYGGRCKKCGEQHAGYLETEYEWCRSCQINYLKENFVNWTSKNDEIDKYIQEMQLNVNHHNDIVFEWIPYNQFGNIKEIKKDEFTVIFSAIWENGPLKYKKNEMIRESDKNVVLKYVHNIDELLNKVKEYSIEFLSNILKIYGLSQNPNTHEYIMVLQLVEGEQCKKCGEQYLNTTYVWCKSCQMNYLRVNYTNRTSGNEKIDDFIQEMQLKFDYSRFLFEWIPYSQLINIEMGKSDFATAIWSDGPLYYDFFTEKEWKRVSNKKVSLKHLYNLRDAAEFLNEANEYLTKSTKNILKIHGISQIPGTNDYIVVFPYTKGEQCEKCDEQYVNAAYKWCEQCQTNSLKANFANWTSDDETINKFIQEMQLKFYYDSYLFEWISYNQLYNVEVVEENELFAIHSAIWKDGPSYYDIFKKENLREPDKKVALKSCNLQNINELLNEVRNNYSVKTYNDIFIVYGISQSPITNNYIIIFEYVKGNKYKVKCEKCGELYTYKRYEWCKSCQLRQFFTSSGSNKIDNFIQEIQSIIKYGDRVFEWIPYNQFNNIREIKELSKDNFSITYSAIWKDGPLRYDFFRIKEWTRESNKKVTLRYTINLQDTTLFLNKVKTYLYSKDDDILKIYGISQNPDTKDFIMVLQYTKEYKERCEKCGEQYLDSTCANFKWCKQCQINFLKTNFTNCSGNEKIDNFIEEMRLNINYYNDIIFEWIPYDQFSDIEKIGKGGFSTVYSAMWKDGPLKFDSLDKKELTRKSSRRVALKQLHNSQNFIDKFLNEAKKYSTHQTYKIFNAGDIINIFGITQNPNTKDYVMVLQHAGGGDFINWININYEDFNWQNKMNILNRIIEGLEKIHFKQMFHRDFHPGNILFGNGYSYANIYISDMGLCGEVGSDESDIYGVMPYVAPEVLRGKPYTQAADIYSFGMIMYFVATGQQPFANCAHDELLLLKICNGIRPEINEQEAPKCYIDLMKKCWDSDPDNRPNATEISKMICSFKCFDNLYSKYALNLSIEMKQQQYEIENQFKEAEDHRKLHRFSSREKKDNITHPQAVYTSRLLNPFISEDLIFDFTKLSNNQNP